jgi:cell division protein FtsZ
MTDPINPLPETALVPKASTIRVLGVGGAGCNAVSHLACELLPGVEFALLSTDRGALHQPGAARRLSLGTKSSRGLGTGGDPERGRAAAEEDAGVIREFCAGADIVFVVAGLGGGTGTGAAPVVARLAKETGALVFGIVMLPFDCEGTRRSRQAQVGMHALKGVADGVICLPNQKVFKLVDENTSLLEAFHITNELVAQGVRGIWRLLFRPGLIRVDFSDLCSVAQGRHAESCLATAQAQGEGRAREAAEKLLAHPLIDEGALLSDADAVLVSIAGGRSLTLGEVNWIMERIRRQCEHAQLTLGAAIDEELGDRIVVTLVASRRAKAQPERGHEIGGSLETTGRLAEQPLDSSTPSRSASRFVPPPPVLSPERTEELFTQQNSGRPRKSGSRLKQAQLPLEIISKGRFEKSEPTIHHGQDLDVPTYLRRGVALN